MVSHVEIFTINPSKKAQFLESMRRIMAYYAKKFPEADKTLMIPLEDYVDVNPNTQTPPNRWVVLETFASEEAMKKAREVKFADPEWREIMRVSQEAGFVPLDFTHCFCEVIK
jgi:hypothetical protein